MDSSFYTRVGEGKYEVHFETGEKWKYVLVEAACREAIGHGKALMVTENIVRCGECKFSNWYESVDGEQLCYCMEHGSTRHKETDYCNYGEREVQE